MKRKLVPVMIGLLVILTVMGGCATSVGRIARDPQAYNGKDLKIKGVAGKGFTIPLTEIYVFLLKGEESSVPVVALKKAEEGTTVVISGIVWAFPRDGMEAQTVQAVEAVQDFLIDEDLVERKRARDAAALVLTAVGKLADGLGHVWFIIENT